MLPESEVDLEEAMRSVTLDHTQVQGMDQTGINLKTYPKLPGEDLHFDEYTHPFDLDKLKQDQKLKQQSDANQEDAETPEQSNRQLLSKAAVVIPYKVTWEPLGEDIICYYPDCG